MTNIFSLINIEKYFKRCGLNIIIFYDIIIHAGWKENFLKYCIKCGAPNVFFTKI